MPLRDRAARGRNWSTNPCQEEQPRIRIIYIMLNALYGHQPEDLSNVSLQKVVPVFCTNLYPPPSPVLFSIDVREGTDKELQADQDI